jgi:hypothetical protein
MKFMCFQTYSPVFRCYRFPVISISCARGPPKSQLTFSEPLPSSCLSAPEFHHPAPTE